MQAYGGGDGDHLWWWNSSISERREESQSDQLEKKKIWGENQPPVDPQQAGDSCGKKGFATPTSSIDLKVFGENSEEGTHLK